MTRLARLLRETGGASAAEFAIVLPFFVLLLLGMIDVGRFMWEYNNAEKATQMGVRYAVVTDLVPAGLKDYSFAVEDNILAGSPVPAANFSSAICTQAGCTCSGSSCGGVGGFDGTAFAAIVDHMNDHYAPVAEANVVVEYRNVGLGYAGDPNGPDVAPLVTVRLTDLQFSPIMLFGMASFDIPDFSAALTLEDGDGNVSN